MESFWFKAREAACGFCRRRLCHPQLECLGDPPWECIPRPPPIDHQVQKEVQWRANFLEPCLLSVDLQGLQATPTPRFEAGFHFRLCHATPYQDSTGRAPWYQSPLPEVQRLPNQKLPVFPDLLATWASLHGQVAWASGTIQKKQRNIQIDRYF